ncbi:hypothetical protein ACVXG7_04050 [Enterobacter hormaechei]
MKKSWDIEPLSRDLLLTPVHYMKLVSAWSTSRHRCTQAWLVRNLDLPGYTPPRRSCWPPCC